MHENGMRPCVVNDYGDCNVSDKVIRLIQGYTELVNKNIWRKTK